MLFRSEDDELGGVDKYQSPRLSGEPISERYMPMDEAPAYERSAAANSNVKSLQADIEQLKSMVVELAKKLGRTPTNISKHLYVLKNAGMLVFTRRLYQLPRHFIVSAEHRHLDFGHGLMRMPRPDQTSANANCSPIISSKNPSPR